MRYLKVLVITALAVIAASCSKQDAALVVDSNDIVLSSKQEYLIKSNKANVTFTSRNTNVAVVDENTGVVTAVRVGQTVIDVVSSRGSYQVNVTVEPKFFTYDEPCLAFGMSRASVLGMFGEPYRLTEEFASYYYWSWSVPYDGYNFKNGKLESSFVVLSKDLLPEAQAFLSERYAEYGEGVYVDDVQNPKLGIEISRQVNNPDYYRINYTPYSPKMKGLEIPPEEIIDDIIPLFVEKPKKK